MEIQDITLFFRKCCFSLVVKKVHAAELDSCIKVRVVQHLSMKMLHKHDKSDQATNSTHVLNIENLWFPYVCLQCVGHRWFFTLCVSGRGNIIGPVCLCVCLSVVGTLMPV